MKTVISTILVFMVVTLFFCNEASSDQVDNQQQKISTIPSHVLNSLETLQTPIGWTLPKKH